ncbi:MAG: DEAD/DEAH box helicase [Nevskia sp.]|nr:DEAD/DEAH box helicase [Nevskia sp.]
MSFSELGLGPELLRAIAEEGYTEPTPIQRQAIPVVLQRRDVLAAAQTGTGKTAAFTLPILQLLSTTGAPGPRVLVLVPTRELAAQVAESVRTYGRHLKLRTAVIFGGVGINPQIDLLRRGVDIVVATPGRLLDHLQQKTVDLRRIDTLVLDEADRMLDMGFIRDIRKVLAALPKQRQNLLFSATFNPEIRSLAEGLQHNPATVEVAPRNTAAELVAQRVHPVDKGRKTALLAHLVKQGDWRQVLVFTRTKHGANRLSEQLERSGIGSAAIHGNKSQNARTRALADFKAGQVRVLVATDIAARGIDIDQLPHVVNFELPNVPEDYVHRIGRTGRAGAEGEAISLVSGDERPLLKDIQKLLRREIPSSTVPGFEPGSAPTAEESARHAAVKLPEQAQHKRGATPNLPRHGGFGHGGGVRPQRDAERRAGKSRKVH